MDSMQSLKPCRSSALWMDSGLVPSSLTPYFFRIPCSCSAMARFRPVWPPSVGRMESGCSISMTAVSGGDVQGFDVDMVSNVLVSHDGGGVGVDQHHLQALLLQGAAGLGTGVVELGGLTDDDGAAADDQHLFNIQDS